VFRWDFVALLWLTADDERRESVGRYGDAFALLAALFGIARAGQVENGVRLLRVLAGERAELLLARADYDHDAPIEARTGLATLFAMGLVVRHDQIGLAKASKRVASWARALSRVADAEPLSRLRWCWLPECSQGGHSPSHCHGGPLFLDRAPRHAVKPSVYCCRAHKAATERKYTLNFNVSDLAARIRRDQSQPPLLIRFLSPR
jgi:hypothetical protein